MKQFAWWTFRIFFIFFCLGEGWKGESEAPGRGGGRFSVENPRGGGGSSYERGGSGEGPGGCLRFFFFFGGGGEAKYFCSGPKFPPSLSSDFRGILLPIDLWNLLCSLHIFRCDPEVACGRVAVFIQQNGKTRKIFSHLACRNSFFFFTEGLSRNSFVKSAVWIDFTSHFTEPFGELIVKS